MRASFFYIIITFLILAILPSCEKTCEDVQVGTRALRQTTKDQIPYKVGDTLTYTNDSLGEIKLTVLEEPGSPRLCQKVICRPWDPYKNRGCEYILGESKYFVIRDDSTTILHFKVGMDQRKDLSSDIYEWIEYGAAGPFSSVFGGMVTDLPFDTTGTQFYTPFLTTLQDVPEFYAETVKFENVSIASSEGFQIVVRKKKGILAYRIETGWWFLKE